MISSSDFKVAVLDTNIIDYSFKPATKATAASVLATAAKKYNLVISEYVRFEVYRGLSMANLPKAKALVDSFMAYPVDKEVLDVAAALTTCYECDEQTKSQRGAYSDGDIIIGATAFKYKLVIITANRKDFPAPYFDEVGKYTVVNKANKPISIYELKPDILYLNKMLNVCYPKPKK